MDTLLAAFITFLISANIPSVNCLFTLKSSASLIWKGENDREHARSTDSMVVTLFLAKAEMTGWVQMKF